jgi:TRAP-type C4-dicarboxylate transport system permease small subunit
MWIPQMVMVIGTFILAIAFLDRFYQAIFFKFEELETAWKVEDEKAIDSIDDKKLKNLENSK